MHAHGPGLLLVQRQQVDPPAQDIQRHQTNEHGYDGKGHILQPRAGQAAHEPVGDLRKLVGGIGYQLHIGGTGGEQGPDHHAGQQNGHHLIAPGAPGDGIHQRHGQQAAAKGQDRDAAAGKAQQDSQRGPEAGSGGGAQNVRRCHGIAEYALIGGAGGGQASAHHAGK